MQKDYSWNPKTCICENSKYLKRVADTSVTECDGIVIARDIVSTKKTNIIATNVTSTVLINCHSKKVKDCYIFHKVLLVIILLLVITVICYHYAKKRYNIKWKIIEFKEVRIKNRTFYYFHDMTLILIKF